MLLRRIALALTSFVWLSSPAAAQRFFGRDPAPERRRT
jgi:hypothetical protein